MSDPGPPIEERLRAAERLHRAREYAALVAMLEALPPEELRRAPALGYLLADALHRVGRRAEALPLAQSLAPACARRGNDALFRARLNLEGVLLFGLGRTAGAEAAWTELLAASAEAGDENFVARSNQNLGVVHTVRGEREAALASYARAIAAYRRLGYLRGLAQVHENQAITYREIDFWREADEHFLRALEYASADGSRDEVARARQERALLLCYQGDRRLASATARQALREWERLDDPVGLGETHRVLGLIALDDGRPDDARREASAALALAERSGAPLLEAESSELLAVLAARAGDAAAADAHRARAGAIFSSIGAEAWGRGARARAEWLASRA